MRCAGGGPPAPTGSGTLQEPMQGDAPPWKDLALRDMGKSSPGLGTASRRNIELHQVLHQQPPRLLQQLQPQLQLCGECQSRKIICILNFQKKAAKTCCGRQNLNTLSMELTIWQNVWNGNQMVQMIQKYFLIQGFW